MVAVQTVTQTQKSSEPKTVAVQILGALLKQRSSSESQQLAPQPKTVLFTRDDVGDIKILNDRTVVLTANDHAFRDGFDGFIVRNGGSDYFVKSIIGYSK
jgi:hypothetical protein